MQNSNIEKLVEDFENYLSNCKGRLLNSNEIVVSRDEVDFYIGNIKSAIKPEFARLNKLMQNKEEILKDARKRADEIIARANVQVNEITNELQVMQQAYERANQIIATAEMEADEIIANARRNSREMQMGAVYYTDDLLREVQIRIKETIEANTRSLDEANRGLRKIFETVNENRKELPIKDDREAAKLAAEPAKAEKTEDRKMLSSDQLDTPLVKEVNQEESKMKSVKISLKADSPEAISSLAKEALE